MSITLVRSSPTGNLRLLFVCLFVCLFVRSFVRSFVLFVLLVLFVAAAVADGHNAWNAPDSLSLSLSDMRSWAAQGSSRPSSEV